MCRLNHKLTETEKEQLLEGSWLASDTNEASVYTIVESIVYNRLLQREFEWSNWLIHLDELLGIPSSSNEGEPPVDGDDGHEFFIEEWLKHRMKQLKYLERFTFSVESTLGHPSVAQIWRDGVMIFHGRSFL